MHDVAVVGLGAVGSFTAAELARRGHSVLGLDRFRPPHEMGSSHGDTRLIRGAPYLGSPYAPLLLRARDLWAELEEVCGRRLLRTSGVLSIGPPEGRAGIVDERHVVSQVRRRAREPGHRRRLERIKLWPLRTQNSRRICRSPSHGM